jgi:hypothetical protein
VLAAASTATILVLVISSEVERSLTPDDIQNDHYSGRKKHLSDSRRESHAGLRFGCLRLMSYAL